MARVMLNIKIFAKHFWAEAVNIACYISNREFLRYGPNQTPYGLWKGKKPNVSYFRVFGSTCFILRDWEHFAKFDSKSDEGIFLRNSTSSRASRVYNYRTGTIMSILMTLLPLLRWH
ncbi:unnamed protein product [Prunus brigantina]